ncbi:unnamed protein product [Camellia sinensis]
MALLVCSPSLSFISSSYRPPTKHQCCLTPTRAESSRTGGGAALLWFKHDLRIHDHPGILAASKYRTLVPFYVFDCRILSRFSDEMLEVLIFAIEDLRKSLKDQGSDLVIRFGTAENVIQELAQGELQALSTHFVTFINKEQVKATNIFAEEEVEYELCRMMDVVRETLATASFPKGNPRFVLWNTPLYDIKNLKDLPASYHEFMKLKVPVISPLSLPKLPNLEVDLTLGSIPALDDLKKFMNDCLGKSKDNWTSIKEISAETVLCKNQFVRTSNQIEGLGSSKLGESNQNSSYKHGQSKRQESVFVTQRGNLVGGGSTVVLKALAAYLRYLEGTIRDDWKEYVRVHEKLRNAESREGASFGTLFGAALCLGIVSRRRAYYEAIKYERERNAGFLSPFGYSAATVAAVADTVCSMECFLIQYTVVGHEGPAILLVHGFGAFLEHYRDNINGIAEGGNRVWAITLLGFGRSEKPNVVYTEVMWAELIRDFIIEVVGEPVHLVGNSMGGYFVAIVAGLWPAVGKSVVLINTAGNVVPRYSSVPFSEERQTSGAAWLGARLLLLYLRSTIESIVKNCYPTQNQVLVIQGMKDPIADSKSKLAMLREHCKGIIIKELDAGHCPHDERPEVVNSIIQEWVVTVGTKILCGDRV